MDWKKEMEEITKKGFIEDVAERDSVLFHMIPDEPSGFRQEMLNQEVHFCIRGYLKAFKREGLTPVCIEVEKPIDVIKKVANIIPGKKGNVFMFKSMKFRIYIREGLCSHENKKECLLALQKWTGPEHMGLGCACGIAVSNFLKAV